MREFDMDTIRMITGFENLTHAKVRDCIRNDVIYFLVEPGDAYKAIGKGGETIKKVEELVGKRIHILEWAEKKEDFVKNLVQGMKTIEIKENTAIVTVDSKMRSAVIGKGGANIKVLRELLERNSELKDLKVV